MRNKRSFIYQCFFTALSCAVFSSAAMAELIRLGPFDVNPEFSVEGIWSDNVEGTRRSQATAQMEDYYVIYGIGMDIKADLTPDWMIESDLAVSMERHLERKDLNQNDVGDLFGKFTIDNEIKTGYYEMDLEGRYEKTTEVEDDEFISGSLNTRDPHTILFGKGALSWSRKQWDLKTTYSYEHERHDLGEFQQGDKNEQSIVVNAKWNTHNRFATVYDYTREKTELINVDDDPANNIWEETQFAGFQFGLLLGDPSLTYTIGMEKEDDLGKAGEWELIHNFNGAIEMDLTRNMLFEGSFAYSIEDNQESDDVGFTYAASVENEFSSDLKHKLIVRREPVGTFDSTVETDSTQYSYELSKENLLLNNINWNFLVGYTRDDPLDGPTERSTTYSSRVAHELEINRKITQTLAYRYTRDEVDTEPEDIIEHRVTLKYAYDF